MPVSAAGTGRASSLVSSTPSPARGRFRHSSRASKSRNGSRIDVRENRPGCVQAVSSQVGPVSTSSSSGSSDSRNGCTVSFSIVGDVRLFLSVQLNCVLCDLSCVLQHTERRGLCAGVPLSRLLGHRPQATEGNPNLVGTELSRVWLVLDCVCCEVALLS